MRIPGRVVIPAHVRAAFDRPQSARRLAGTRERVSSSPLSARLARVDGHEEPVESIRAVPLLTIDMVEAVAFYQALGFPLLYGGTEAAFTSFRVGAGYLNLQLDPAGSPRTDIWGRVVFWVDDVDAMYRRAIAAGFEPNTSPTDAPWGERYFHIHDPDGHELSFARLL
jgi:catechol 2,3-dioxygenase-like lactoylglutathione lyase family enzyme